MRALAPVTACRVLLCLAMGVACAEPNQYDPDAVLRPDALDSAAEAAPITIRDAADAERVPDWDSVSMASEADLGSDSPVVTPVPIDAPIGQPCGDGVGQVCCEGATRACTSACGMGVETCRGGEFTACTARQPTAENCSNGIDDDCDGFADCPDSECHEKICAIDRICSGKRCVSARGVFLYLTTQKYDGALGGREGADAKCRSATDQMGLACKNTRAFIGVTAQDSIAAFAATNVIPGDRPVLDLEGTVRYPNFTALVSGETERAIPIAEFDTPAAPAWWSGAVENGTVESNYTCRGWTSNSPQDFACVGILGTKLDHYCYNRYVCASAYSLACLCW
jgi:hypothetical protein